MKKTRKKSNLKGSVSIRLGVVFLFLLLGVSILKADSKESPKDITFWKVQSIDTMKYSRDAAREKLKDPSYDTQIYQHVKEIADTGATHVSIGTPYDEEFIPVLRRWVNAARSNNLNVWFRGNFSGWEGWFEYKKISRDDHKRLLENFITKHSDIFENGDILTACPECENGGNGDPRNTGDKEGFRNFLIEEHEIMQDVFGKTGKNVIFNYNSMNGDVARLIMDKKTTQKLGGIVAIDHYVASGSITSFDITEIAMASGGKVVLSEFGAPIPDIHGKMNEGDQAEWVMTTMSELVTNKDLVGVNYWVGRGGSTKLWNDDGSEREAVGSLKAAYTPKVLTGKVVNTYGKAIPGVGVTTLSYASNSAPDGSFTIPYIEDKDTVHLEAKDYKPIDVSLSYLIANKEVRMQSVKNEPGAVKRKFLKFIFKIDIFSIFK